MKNKSLFINLILLGITGILCVVFYFILPHEIPITIDSSATIDGDPSIQNTMSSIVLLACVFGIMAIVTFVSFLHDTVRWRIVSIILFILDILTLFLV